MYTANSSSRIEMLLIFWIYLNFCQGQIGTAEYKNLPALYKFDNYHECINRDQSEPHYAAKYCMVFVQIQADNDSVLWQQIESMRLNKYYYRHDHLFRGLCIEGCKDLLENNVPARSYEDRVLSNDQTQMFQRFYKSTTDLLMRYKYRYKIAECVNREYEGNYNLSTKTFVNFCINPQESRGKGYYKSPFNIFEKSSKSHTIPMLDFHIYNSGGVESF